jgi:hypothetical protein
LSGLIGPMARNLVATNEALNALDQVAKNGTPDDERLQQMHAQLQQIADQQNAMLNVFSGTYDSYTSNELLGRGNPHRRYGLGRRDRFCAPVQCAHDRPNSRTAIGIKRCGAYRRVVTTLPLNRCSRDGITR